MRINNNKIIIFFSVCRHRPPRDIVYWLTWCVVSTYDRLPHEPQTVSSLGFWTNSPWKLDDQSHQSDRECLDWIQFIITVKVSRRGLKLHRGNKLPRCMTYFSIQGGSYLCWPVHGPALHGDRCTAGCEAHTNLPMIQYAWWSITFGIKGRY
jgi:hypothetical protein